MSPRVASRQPNRICFLLESPPVSTSAPGSTPGRHGKARFSGIAYNRSSIVVTSFLGFLLLLEVRFEGLVRIRGAVCGSGGVSSSEGSGDSRVRVLDRAREM